MCARVSLLVVFPHPPTDAAQQLLAQTLLLPLLSAFIYLLLSKTGGFFFMTLVRDLWLFSL